MGQTCDGDLQDAPAPPPTPLCRLHVSAHGAAPAVRAVWLPTSASSNTYSGGVEHSARDRGARVAV